MRCRNLDRRLPDPPHPLNGERESNRKRHLATKTQSQQGELRGKPQSGAEVRKGKKKSESTRAKGGVTGKEQAKGVGK